MKTHTLVISAVMVLMLASIALADIDTDMNHAIYYKYPNPNLQNDLIGNINTLGSINDAYNESAYFPTSDFSYQFVANEQWYSSPLPRGSGVGTGAENLTTLCFRVKNNAPTSTNLIIGHILNSGSDRWWPFKFTFESGNITFWERTNAAWESVTGHQLSGWNRICGVQNGTHLWLYENGNLVTDAELSAAIRVAGNPAVDDWRYTTGDGSSATQNFTLQDFVTYTRILTAQEIMDGQNVYLTSGTAPHWTAIPAPQVTWDSPAADLNWTGMVNFSYFVDSADTCALLEDGVVAASHSSVTTSDFFLYSPSINSSYSSSFAINCSNTFGSNMTESRTQSFDTLYKIASVYWDNSSYEPKNGDKYASAQTFYFNVNRLANCTFFANGSSYASKETSGEDGFFYNITPPIASGFMPFTIECSDLNGTASSTTKYVVFDTENPLSCPEGCQPSELNTTVVNKRESNLSVFLECINTHLEQLNYSIGNSSTTLAQDSIDLNRSEINASFILDTSPLAIGQYNVFLSCFENPKVSTAQFHFQVTCTEAWTCTAFTGTCNGFDATLQTRTCTDDNACGTELSKPAESQVCATPNAGGASFERNNIRGNYGLGFYSMLTEFGRGFSNFVRFITMPLGTLLLIIGVIGALGIAIVGLFKGIKPKV